MPASALRSYWAGQETEISRNVLSDIKSEFLMRELVLTSSVHVSLPPCGKGVPVQFQWPSLINHNYDLTVVIVNGLLDFGVLVGQRASLRMFVIRHLSYKLKD